jgi:hypothetical protein
MIPIRHLSLCCLWILCLLFVGACSGDPSAAGGPAGSGGDPGLGKPNGVPEHPAVLGLVAETDIGPGAVCGCSRREGFAVHLRCPRGLGAWTQATVNVTRMTASLTGTTSTRGTAFKLTLAALGQNDEVDVYLEETSVKPPEGAYDLSPVYFMKTNDSDVVFAVDVPFQSDVGVYGDEVGIYHSVDGDSFARLEDTYRNAGFAQATVAGGGYLFVAANACAPCIYDDYLSIGGGAIEYECPGG